MSKGFIVGMAGEPLNFDVVGSEAQPADRENRIWVNTDTPVSSWVFSPAAPSEPEEGTVWFRLEAVSPVSMDALRRNSIILCPGSCSQYVSGSWELKKAMSFISSRWHEWVRFLIADGQMKETWTFSTATYSIGDDCLHIAPSVALHGSGSMSVSLDVTDYSILKAEVQYTGDSRAAGASVSVGESSLSVKSATARTEKTIDLTGITGTQTIRFGVQNGNDEIGEIYGASMNVYNVTLS